MIETLSSFEYLPEGWPVRLSEGVDRTTGAYFDLSGDVYVSSLYELLSEQLSISLTQSMNACKNNFVFVRLTLSSLRETITNFTFIVFDTKM